LQNHAILTSHKLSPHTNSQDLTWQECQAKKEAPHLWASHSTTKVFSSTSKWMKPYGQGADADATYHDSYPYITCHRSFWELWYFPIYT
jgi:hypothetical protein